MNKSVTFKRFALAALAITGIVIAGYYSKQQIDQAALRSCIWSLEGPIRDQLNIDISNESSSPHEWKVLNSGFVKSLADKAVKSGRADCSRIQSVGNGMDIWDNEIKVATRLRGSQKAVRIWSLGPDGHDNSDDDIVVETP